MEKAQEHKTLPSFVTKIDGDLGIVEHTVAVMGNVDLGGDRIHPGAFTKTITERAGQIRVLDAHNSGKVADVLGKPLALWEVGRDQLGPEIKAQFPDATGALMARTQFLMDTPEGRGAFVRIRDGAVDQYSIGYDALDVDFTEEQKDDGPDETVRNLRTIRLWEYSPVAFAMNPATATVSAKEAGEPDIYKEQWEEIKAGHLAQWIKDATEEERANLWQAYVMREGKHALEDSAGTEPPRFVGTDDADPADETKVGRAISAANAGRIRGAIDRAQDALMDLEAMLDSALPNTDEPEQEPDDEQAKAALATEPGQAATGQDPEAGPNDSSPTRADQLAEIDQLIKTAERELLEVNSG